MQRLTDNPSPTAIILYVIAVVRLTRLVLTDEITEPMRNYVYEKTQVAHPKIAYLITCPWCISIYAAILLVFAPTTLHAVLTASEVTGFLASHPDTQPFT